MTRMFFIRAIRDIRGLLFFTVTRPAVAASGSEFEPGILEF